MGGDKAEKLLVQLRLYGLINECIHHVGKHFPVRRIPSALWARRRKDRAGESVPVVRNGQLEISLRAPTVVSVAVYDIAGRLVARPADGTYVPGKHTFTFDASVAGAGLFVVRAVVGKKTYTYRDLSLGQWFVEASLQPGRGAALRKAAALDSTSSYAHFHLGLSLQALGRIDEALQELHLFLKYAGEDEASMKITAEEAIAEIKAARPK